jgi:WhiB family redox-sensing transcriptional regulator
MQSRPGDEPPTVASILADILRRPAWQADAACRGVGPDVFWTGRGGDNKPAKALCALCPVVGECRDYAAEIGAEGGVWAGVVSSHIHSAGKRVA